MRENQSRFMEDFSAYLLNDRPVDVEDCFFLERGGHHYEAVDGIGLLLFWSPTIVANKDFIRSTVDGPVVLTFKVK
jgi:hypothetical protein